MARVLVAEWSLPVTRTALAFPPDDALFEINPLGQVPVPIRDDGTSAFPSLVVLEDLCRVGSAGDLPDLVVEPLSERPSRPAARWREAGRRISGPCPGSGIGRFDVPDAPVFGYHAVTVPGPRRAAVQGFIDWLKDLAVDWRSGS